MCDTPIYVGACYTRGARRSWYICDHSFLGDSIRSFFPSRPQYAILGTGILGQIASFERRLRGAAQKPLALPYPFRTWPGSGTWAERDKQEVRKILYFGRYTSELFLDLGMCRAWTKKTYLVWENIYFQVGIISKLASYFVPTTLFSWSHLEAFGLLCTSHDWLLCRCFSISDFKVKYLCSSVRCVRGGPFPTQRHHYTQCSCWFFILERCNLLFCGHRLWWDRVNQTIAINQGISKWNASNVPGTRTQQNRPDHKITNRKQTQRTESLLKIAVRETMFCQSFSSPLQRVVPYKMVQDPRSIFQDRIINFPH